MKTLFYKFWENIVNTFKGYNLIYHLIAIVSTYIIVVSGFDWKYFQFFRGSRLYYILFSAVFVGGTFPVLVPIVVLIFGKIRKSINLLNTGYALAQAAIIGSIISSFYKMLTGRAHPNSIHSLTIFSKTLTGTPYSNLLNTTNIDTTHIFNFGFFRGGIFWGWPSSHTTLAFAMAFTLWALYSENKIVRTLALVYAVYVGLGVSMTIHWFSDFVAGAIIGIVIGAVVGKAFKAKIRPTYL